MDVTTRFATVEEAIEEIREGRMVVVVDDEDRENEGDLTIAAQFATPDAINFMATHARGLICLCLTEERADELALRPMTDHNETPLGTAFTVSVEAREARTPGISAADRSRTIQVAIHPASTPHDLVQPGHVFPLRAKPGGVLERIGQTEAAVDLARLAGLNPSGVICEIMNDDGTMARVDDLVPYCERHGLKMITVADLVEYRRRHEKLVERGASVRLPTEFGEFTAVAFREKLNGKTHVALVKGDVDGAENVLVRVHSECLTGDVFHSLRCDCGEQLDQALAQIEAEGPRVPPLTGPSLSGPIVPTALTPPELPLSTPPEGTPPEQLQVSEDTDESLEDPFEGWPASESSAVIEESPPDGSSVEHVRGEVDVPSGFTVLEGMPLGNRRSVGVVVSRFNGGVTNRMLQVALDALPEAGGVPDGIPALAVSGG